MACLALLIVMSEDKGCIEESPRNSTDFLDYCVIPSGENLRLEFCSLG